MFGMLIQLPVSVGNHFFRRFFGAEFLLVLIILLLASVPLRAAVFYISDASDSTNVTSLRGAIIAANASGGTNLIILTNSVYLTVQGADEDASFSGDLDVTNGNLTILGLSNSNIVIDATSLRDRAFQIFPEAQLIPTRSDNRYIAIALFSLSPQRGPRCAKRTSLMGKPNRGGLGKPLGWGEG